MASIRHQIKQTFEKSVGSSFWVSKTITSSAVTTAAIDLTTAATGRLFVRQIIAKTDSTGLAGGTNFEIKSNNAKGTLNIFVETVANLGASITKVLSPGVTAADTTTSDATPTVTALQTILEAGKKLTYDMTSSAGTGAGTIDVHIEFVRIDANADLVAA